MLPHSPLHVKCLADTEERVESGHVKSIVVYVRETRLTNLFSNILIGVSMLFLVYVLKYIPTPVLDGLFLYLAVTALFGNQMFERILLFFMEKSAYPPNHYIRKVPEQKMHTFTLCQIVQLGILCAFGTYAYVNLNSKKKFSSNDHFIDITCRIQHLGLCKNDLPRGPVFIFTNSTIADS